ncbi:Histone-lysine N-methyltransferase pr-set7 [Bagarius yarrelli]|uniref:Histone-lysine N-methyltransferase pr-set7 n=1 Tax=Bagarius yarrelli TaxID=175774 RepID=A0A556U564_BAGYA|nr:Histone-lysine N-methyltransferase pr-set7 [Bagarius yarrelli]
MLTFVMSVDIFCIHSIDASVDDGSFGRLINDDSNPNAKVKIIFISRIPHLCLFALRDIQPGEEITYDYGGYDLPWRRGTHECEKEEPVRADKATQTEGENTSVEEIIWKYIPYQCLTSEHQTPVNESTSISEDPATSRQMTDEVKGMECNDRAEQILAQPHTSMDTEPPYAKESYPTSTAQQHLEQQLTDNQQCEEQSDPMSAAQSMCEEVQLTCQDEACQMQSSEADQDLELSNEESNDEIISSDEEFIPDSDKESDDDSDMEKPKKKSKTPDASKKVEEQANPSTQNHLITQATKLNFCFVCGKSCSKIARHLKIHRKDNIEIATAFKLGKNSKERSRILEVLRNRGNYQHNNSVLSEGSGLIKVKRTPKTDIDTQKLEFCMYCKGLYSRKMLWKHARRCTSNPEKEAPKTSRTVLGLAALAQCPHLQNISEDVKKMICDMHQDEVAQLVRNDEYVLKLAQDFYDKKGNSKEKHAFIRQTIRCLGKLLILLKNKFAIRNLAEAIKPSSFPMIIETVKEIAEYNDVTKCYSIPSLARRIGLALRKFCVLTAQKAFAVGDRILIQATYTFTELFNNAKSDFALGEIVSLGKFFLLPFINDVRKVHCYLEKAAHSAMKELRETPSAQSYANLCKVTLAQILLFNRRHGEVSQLTIKSFQERDRTNHPEISDFLSELEKVFCADYCKILVRQKVGPLVPIILTPDMIDALMLLTEMRERCSVLKSNIFVFGQPKSNKCYRGENALRICASECDAMIPNNLTSIKISRHISTLTQFLSLKNHELEKLAKFIGHDISLQKEYYRQSEAVPRLAKICKLLLAIEKGKAADILRHSLDAITLPAFLEDPMTRYKFSMHKMYRTKTNTTNYGASEPKRKKLDNESASKEQVNKSTSKKQVNKSTSKEQQNKSTSKEQQNNKKKWTEEEQNAIMKHFKRHIYYGKLATIQESRRCQMLEQPVLDGRTIQKIRDFVRNAGVSVRKKMSFKKCLKKHVTSPSQPAMPNSPSVQSPESTNISASSEPSSQTTNPTSSSEISPPTTDLNKPIILFPQNANSTATTTLPSQVTLSTTPNAAHPQAKLIYIKVQANNSANQTTTSLPITSQAANPSIVPAGLMVPLPAITSISSANVLQIPQVANSSIIIPQLLNPTGFSQPHLQPASLICGGVLVPQAPNSTTVRNILTLPAAQSQSFTTVPSQIAVLDNVTPPAQAANISNIGILTLPNQPQQHSSI